MLPEEFIENAKEFIPDIKLHQRNFKIDENYSEMVDNFLKN